MSERPIRRVRSAATSSRQRMALRRRRSHRRHSVYPLPSSSSFSSSTTNTHYINTNSNTTLATMTAVAMLEGEGEGEGAESSVLSDFDVLNDAIQEFLLSSDDDSGDDVSGYYGEVDIIHAVAPFLNAASLRPAVRSTRHARKSTSATKTSSITTTTIAPLPGLTLAESMLPRRVRRRRRLLLPRDKGLPQAPLCIVLDLDETLVAARRDGVHARPHVKEFLDACHAEGCEVVVWSAGSPSHVNGVIRAVAAASQRRDWYHHIISRHRRWFHEESECVKDLALLGRPLNRVLMLENSPRSVQRQPMHAILLEDYVSPNAHDDSLRLLAGVVRRLVAAMRASDDIANADVSHLLSADTTLMELLLPSLHSLSKDGSTMISRGLLYSPQTVFSCRSYGGEHPLSYQGRT
ncbi:FCP1 homology domain [Trypanosoma melophagium]|uniref:FCP1 homology domain n=1 Tax=Trypanosoma melophagium TaxID=715481 RepID=UPI00351A4053|nr:FCP1 homology domain [Trypanosoma melophagium]